jgi:hypothetical protein
MITASLPVKTQCLLFEVGKVVMTMFILRINEVYMTRVPGLYLLQCRRLADGLRPNSIGPASVLAFRLYP